jgi:hypothetical protein
MDGLLRELTLDDARNFLGSTLLQLGFYVVLRAYVTAKDGEGAKTPEASHRVERSKAWILSLLNAVVLTLNGLRFIPFMLKYPLAHSSGDTPAVRAAWLLENETDDAIGRFVCVYFSSFMILDLIVGLVDYRKQIDLVSGYIHHALYLLLMFIALTSHWCTAVSVHHVLELPTLILALGSVFPALRADLAMGVTFFATRILINIWSVWQHCSWSPEAHPSWPWVVCPALAMHSYWFFGWAMRHSPCAKSSRRSKDKAAAAEKAAAEMPSGSGAGAMPSAASASSDSALRKRAVH